MDKDTDSILWLGAPAGDDWNCALPIGNGRLGAMVYGNVVSERLQLNEDSLWNGGPRDRNNPDTRTHLPELRRLLAEGRLAEAHARVHDIMAGIPDSQRCYEPLADLFLQIAHDGVEVSVPPGQLALADGYTTPHFDPALLTAYRRTLDLRTAVVSTAYTLAGRNYTREHFVSHPAQALLVRLEGGPFSLRLRMERGPRESYSTRYADSVGFSREPDKTADADTATPLLLLRGRAGGEGGVGFAVALGAAVEGGRIRTIGETLYVENAKAVTLALSAATTFREAAPADTAMRRVRDALRSGWETLREAHLRDYGKLYNRASLRLGPMPSGDTPATPTDVRLREFSAGKSDPALAALYFNYARYLLISSSRPGSLPANLQGIWNKDFWPAWGSKYTININTQMNYWIAEPANLADCHQALLDHLDRMIESGRRTAETMYGCRGFVAHHNLDIWADTAPTDRNAGASYWVLGGAWLVLHAWDHFDFAREPAALRKAYTMLKEASLFFLDFLIEDAQGRLIVSPSCSPENTYRLPNGESGVLCAGATMDSQILTMLFQRTQQAAAQLRLIAPEEAAAEDRFIAEVARAEAKLPPMRVGRHGQLMEWTEDHDEPEPHHRHVAHGFGLHPGTLVSPRKTPELAEALRTTLERRGDEGTGWCMAWKACFWARLGKGQRAHRLLKNLLYPVGTAAPKTQDHTYTDGGSYPNLLCAHPPFQIDGNFGGATAILEMLLQSHEIDQDADEDGRAQASGIPVIHLLPALPAEWSEGEFHGLRVRGGCEIALRWSNARPVSATLRNCRPSSLTLRLLHAGTARIVHLRPNETLVIADFA